MSYKCGYCGKVQPSGAKPRKIPQLVMTIHQVVQEEYEHREGLNRAYSEVSYRIGGEKQACPKCAQSQSLLNNVVKVVDETGSYLKPDTREKEIPPGFYLLYSVIVFSNPSFKIVSTDKADFRKTSFRSFSSLLSF